MFIDVDDEDGPPRFDGAKMQLLRDEIHASLPMPEMAMPVTPMAFYVRVFMPFIRVAFARAHVIFVLLRSELDSERLDDVSRAARTSVGTRIYWPAHCLIFIPRVLLSSRRRAHVCRGECFFTSSLSGHGGIPTMITGDSS